MQPQKPWLVTMERFITPYGHVERTTCLWYATDSSEAWDEMTTQLMRWNDRRKVVKVVPYPED